MRHDATSVDKMSDNNKQGSQNKDIYYLNVFSNQLILARNMTRFKLLLNLSRLKEC